MLHLYMESLHFYMQFPNIHFFSHSKNELELGCNPGISLLSYENNDELAVAKSLHAGFMATGGKTQGIFADLEEFDHLAPFGFHFYVNSLDPLAGPNILTPF